MGDSKLAVVLTVIVQSSTLNGASIPHARMEEERGRGRELSGGNRKVEESWGGLRYNVYMYGTVKE